MLVWLWAWQAGEVHLLLCLGGTEAQRTPRVSGNDTRLQERRPDGNDKKWIIAMTQKEGSF